MQFTVTVYQKKSGMYLCRLDFEYDNWLQRKVENGGYWKAVPGVFNLSSGRFAFRQGFLLKPDHGTYLTLADSGRAMFHKVTGWKQVMKLEDFPERPKPSLEGEGWVGSDGANRMVGEEFTKIRWVVRSVNGEVALFPRR